MRLLALFVALSSLAGPVGAVDAPVATNSTAIYSRGRVVPRPFGKTTVFEYQWPGVYFEAPFNSRFVTVKVNDSANRLAFLVDGRPVKTVSRPGEAAIRLGPFAPGYHVLRMEKLSETAGNTATLIGVFPDTVSNIPLPERAKQIEFIGDSITVGYGNTANTQQCSRDEVWATTDTSQAFGPLVAKHYDADHQVNAISGRGVVRNFNGFASPHLPEAYPYALLDGATKSDDPDWRPQIMVVWLGTNDFSTPLNPGEKWATRQALQTDYEATYAKFVQDLRAKNPNAFFILMAQGPASGELSSEVQKVIARLTAAGERRIAFLPAPSLKFGGCDGHPDTGDDWAIANSLIAFIDTHSDLWQGK